MILCLVQYAVVGRGLDSNVVTRYWLDAVRHQPERNDNMSSLWSVAMHIIQQETLKRSDEP